MLSDVQALVRSYARVPDSIVSRAPGGDEEKAIASAVREYSRRRPRRFVKEFTSTGVTSYSLTTLVPGWNLDQYNIVNVFFQAGGQRSKLPTLYWRIVPTEADLEFRLDLVLRTGLICLECTGPHRLDNVVDTIAMHHPDDVDAVAHLGAAYVLAQAANKLIPQNNSDIHADSVDQSEQRKGYALQARDEQASFDRVVSAAPTISSIQVEIDPGQDAHGGMGRFWGR